MIALAELDKPGVQDTKTKLILAAEKLFAIHGIEAVALRQITQAAGQRNESALQYHFGSREALIEAIFERRMSVIDQHRNEFLDGLEGEGRIDDVRALVEALVYPMCGRIRHWTGENYYNRFLAEVQRSMKLNVSQFVGQKYDRGLQRAYAHMQHLLSELPTSLFRQR